MVFGLQKLGARLYERAKDKEKFVSNLEKAEKITAGSTSLFTGLASGVGTFALTKSIPASIKVGLGTSTATGLALASPKAVRFVGEKITKITTGQYGAEIGELIEAPKEKKGEKAKTLLKGAGVLGLLTGAGYLAYDWFKGRKEKEKEKPKPEDNMIKEPDWAKGRKEEGKTKENPPINLGGTIPSYSDVTGESNVPFVPVTPQTETIEAGGGRRTSGKRKKRSSALPVHISNRVNIALQQKQGGQVFNKRYIKEYAYN
jgi:hypothetical protein